MVKVVFEWPFDAEIYSVEYEHEGFVVYPEGFEEKVREAATILGNLMKLIGRNEVEIKKIDHENKNIKLYFKTPKILKQIRRDMNEMDEERKRWYSYTMRYVPRNVKKPPSYLPITHKTPYWTEVGDIRKDYL